MGEHWLDSYDVLNKPPILVRPVNFERNNPQQEDGAYPWFKFYSKYIHDEQIVKLDLCSREVFIYILCLASESITGDVRCDYHATTMRLPRRYRVTTVWLRSLKKLEQLQLITTELFTERKKETKIDSVCIVKRDSEREVGKNEVSTEPLLTPVMALPIEVESDADLATQVQSPSNLGLTNLLSESAKASFARQYGAPFVRRQLELMAEWRLKRPSSLLKSPHKFVSAWLFKAKKDFDEGLASESLLDREKEQREQFELEVKRRIFGEE